jgi:dehydrogenase/reductase SDR family protein 12
MGSGYSLVAATQWYVQGNRTYTKQGFEAFRASPAYRPSDLEKDLAGRVMIVTGANSGLGLATARALAGKRAEVHLVVRNAARGAEALAAVKAAAGEGHSSVFLHVADLSEGPSIRAFAAEWLASAKPVHALVNNAGVLSPTRVLNSEGLEASTATALGQSYLLTALLWPALKAGGRADDPSRVINVSSGGGLTVRLDVNDLYGSRREPWDGKLRYAQAKRAQMMLTEAFAAKAAAGANIALHAMHPGWSATEGVATSLPGFGEDLRKGGKDLRSPEEGADTIVWLAAGPPQPPGRLWFDRAPVPMHFPFAGTTSSAGEASALWAACERDWRYVWTP